MKTRSHWVGLGALVTAISAMAACGGSTTNNAAADGGADAGDTDGRVVETPSSTDKLDLLFVVDNSASMGVKQELLARALPDLVQGLIRPPCVDGTGRPVGTADDNGACATGSAAFRPVHDMHLGIVTSSLGGFGSDACKEGEMNPTNPLLDRHNNDKAHLINRGGDNEAPQADASPQNFLAWFPATGQNAGKVSPVPVVVDSNKLISDFSSMVSGVHEYGCGLEAQMEAWYRFLVQPDPWEVIARNQNKAEYSGVDAALLAQRKAFLRPDSTVAVIVVTDEDDSSPDPRALKGQGWAFSNSAFPGSKSNGGAPRGTKICETSPGDPSCSSCGFAQTPNDPNCQINGGYYDPADDTLNVRYFHMKQRFGVDPQFPIRRYVDGLTSAKVPNRDGEHPADGDGSYVGDKNCDNPLFAAELPDPGGDTCHLKRGTRTGGNVVFMVIGGVPNELLHYDPNGDAAANQLGASDWVKILGASPETYDYSGIDPHMIQSIAPRAGLPDPTAVDTADPIHGREWDTRTNQALDLQYACTFPLPAQMNCKDPKFSNTCDCDGSATMPLCAPNPADGNRKSIQTRGKAYPTVRELMVARALGARGVVGSICPLHVQEQGAGDPLYGYRPAMRKLVDALAQGGLAR